MVLPDRAGTPNQSRLPPADEETGELHAHTESLQHDCAGLRDICLAARIFSSRWLKRDVYLIGTTRWLRVIEAPCLAGDWS